MTTTTKPKQSVPVPIRTSSNWALGWAQKSPSGAGEVSSVPNRGSRLSAGLPFTTQWTRPHTELRNALDVHNSRLEWWGSARAPQHALNEAASLDLYGSGLKSVGGLAQLTSKPVGGPANPASHHLFSATPPTFVVPKFRQRNGAVTSVKVGSCPSKLEYGYSGPPGGQADLWGWLSAQTASIHPHNRVNQPPPPSPGLPDLDSSTDFPALVQVNDERSNYINRHFFGDVEASGQAQVEESGHALEGWEAPELDVGNFSFTFSAANDCYLEPPSVDADEPGFVVPRLSNMAGADSVRFAQPTARAGQFQGIRSESMEFAFTPTHLHPGPGSYAVDWLDGEEWFVLRDPHPEHHQRPRTRQASSCAASEASAASHPPKRRRASGHALPLKFHAAKPAKMVQTEPHEALASLLDLANNNGNCGLPWEDWAMEEDNAQPMPHPALPSPHYADAEGRKIVSPSPSLL